MDSKKLQKIIQYAIPIAAFLFVLLFFGVRYETNDDATLANIRAGAYGDALHMIYCNVLYALILKPFYLLAGNLNWYAIIQIILVIVSFEKLSELFSEKIGFSNGTILSLTIIIPYAISIFYSFQYTKNSAVIIAVGLILIADDLGNMGRKTRYGIILTITGSLIRYESFMAVGMISRAMFLGIFFRLDNKSKFKSVCTMLMLFCGFIAVYGINTLYYNSDSEWKRANSYNKRRMSFSDYKAYFLDENENAFPDMLTDAQYGMLMSWDFYDPEFYTEELLETLSSRVPNKSLSTTVKHTIINAVNFTHGTSYRYLFIFVILAGLILIPIGYDMLPFIGTYVMLGLELMYLSYLGRFLPRNEVSMLFAATTMGLFCILESNNRFNLNKSAYAIMLVFMCICSVKTYIRASSDSDIYFGWTEGKQTAIQQMSEDKENLYLIPTSLIDSRAGYDIWHPKSNDFYSNIVAYGGWLSQAKTQKDSLAEYGIVRPLVGAVDKENIIVIPSNTELVLQYVREMTGNEITFENIDGSYFVSGRLVTAEEENNG